jgi:hypothetical protein
VYLLNCPLISKRVCTFNDISFVPPEDGLDYTKHVRANFSTVFYTSSFCSNFKKKFHKPDHINAKLEFHQRSLRENHGPWNAKVSLSQKLFFPRRYHPPGRRRRAWNRCDDRYALSATDHTTSAVKWPAVRRNVPTHRESKTGQKPWQSRTKHITIKKRFTRHEDIYNGSGGIVPLILRLCSVCRWSASGADSFTPRKRYPGTHLTWR